MFSSNARANAQNRALQKSIKAKYYQKLQVSVSGDNPNARRKLSPLSKEQAIHSRIGKLILKAIIAAALLIPFIYFAFIWIDRNLISF